MIKRVGCRANAIGKLRRPLEDHAGFLDSSKRDGFRLFSRGINLSSAALTFGIDPRDGHRTLALSEMPPMDVRRDDERFWILAVQLHELGHHTSTAASFAPVTSIDQRAVFDDKWLLQPVFLDVSGKLIKFIITHHRAHFR